MGALSHLQVVHFATHDSFTEVQNGPTHQPVELDSLYRAMPNLQYIRLCGAEERIGAWKLRLVRDTLHQYCHSAVTLSGMYRTQVATKCPEGRMYFRALQTQKSPWSVAELIFIMLWRQLRP